MNRKKVEKTGSFVAVDESGNRYNIEIFTTFTEHTPVSGPATWLPGSIAHKMQNGNDVNVNSDSTLFDVQTGRVMRRV